MSLFVISDLHLSTNQTTNKSMEVFGARWKDYISKIQKNWNSVISENDTVVVPGDISWALTLEEAYSDLDFVNKLNGKKLLGKGNHDFWWDTAAKLHRFFAENGFTTLSLLYNNAYAVEDFIVCGTRGWFLEEEKQLTVGDVDFAKIQNRETQRLKLSLDAAKLLQQDENANKEILVFLHFPPVWNGFVWQEFIDLMKEYGVKRVFCGHIHGKYNIPRTQVVDGLEITLISSDFSDFIPYIIK